MNMKSDLGTKLNSDNTVSVFVNDTQLHYEAIVQKFILTQ